MPRHSVIRGVSEENLSIAARHSSFRACPQIVTSSFQTLCYVSIIFDVKDRRVYCFNNVELIIDDVNSC